MGMGTRWWVCVPGGYGVECGWEGGGAVGLCGKSAALSWTGHRPTCSNQISTGSRHGKKANNHFFLISAKTAEMVAMFSFINCALNAQ